MMNNKDVGPIFFRSTKRNYNLIPYLKYMIRDLHEIKNRKLRRNKIVARRKILKQIILQMMNNKDVGPIFFRSTKRNYNLIPYLTYDRNLH